MHFSDRRSLLMHSAHCIILLLAYPLKYLLSFFSCKQYKTTKIFGSVLQLSVAKVHVWTRRPDSNCLRYLTFPSSNDSTPLVIVSLQHNKYMITFSWFWTDPFAEANAEDSGAGSKEYVHIRIQQRNGRKSLTTIQGLKKDFNYNRILKDVKKEFCCNGTVVQDPELGQVCIIH